MSTTTYSFDRFEIRKDTLFWALLVVNTEILLLLAYYALGPSELTGIEPIVVPFTWINVSLLVFARTRVPAASDRTQLVGLVVATVYFGLLAYFGGVWSGGISELPPIVSFKLFSLPPGIAPALVVNNDWVYLALIPYRLIGYGALAYLVYVAVLDATGSVITGIFGFLSCVSCSWPIIASIATGILGGGAALTDAVYGQSLLLSTVVFVVTVALLYYRPGWS